MSQEILTYLPPIVLSFKPMRSLYPVEQAQLVQTMGAIKLVQTESGLFIASVTLWTRYGSLGIERVARAVRMVLAECAVDPEAFAGTDFDRHWQENLEYNLLEAERLHEQALADADRTSVERLMGGGNVVQAQVLIRNIINLAEAAAVRHFFLSDSSDVRTPQGVVEVLRELTNKSKSQVLKKRLELCGVSEKMLKEADKLRVMINQELNARYSMEALAERDAQAEEAALVLLAGDVGAFSKTARARFSPEEWQRRFTQGRFFDTTRPGERPVQDEEPAPPAAPGGAAPAGGGTVPVGAAPGTSTAPGGGGVRPGAGPPVSPGHGGSGGPGGIPAGMPVAPGASAGIPAGAGAAAGTGTPGAATPVTPAIPTGAIAGLPPLLPGTVLSVIHTANGPSLEATVQQDGSVAWVPKVATPAATSAAPPAAPAPPATSAEPLPAPASPPAPTPRPGGKPRHSGPRPMTPRRHGRR